MSFISQNFNIFQTNHLHFTRSLKLSLVIKAIREQRIRKLYSFTSRTLKVTCYLWKHFTNWIQVCTHKRQVSVYFEKFLNSKIYIDYLWISQKTFFSILLASNYGLKIVELVEISISISVSTICLVRLILWY